MGMVRKPSWLKMHLPKGGNYNQIKYLRKNSHLHTVCEEALCPNIGECWGSRTAAFMVMGDTCTRNCRFCNVKTALKPPALDVNEPYNLAKTVREMRLYYAVITSVDRDDLSDFGSEHFAECISAVKRENHDIKVEVLIPDFNGNIECLRKIVDAKPDVIGHNIEVVESLQKKVRDRRAGYGQSLKILENVKKLNSDRLNSDNCPIFTKSSIMLGLGETEEEIIQAMKDLSGIGVDILTIGQYLQPSKQNIEVREYVHPDKFEFYRKKGEELGFRYVASGPFVRSSYKAAEFFIKNLISSRT